MLKSSEDNSSSLEWFANLVVPALFTKISILPKKLIVSSTSFLHPESVEISALMQSVFTFLEIQNFSTSNAISIGFNIKRWNQISYRTGILIDYYDSKK